MKIIKSVSKRSEKEQAFKEIYEKYYPQVLAYFLKKINHRHDAEDLTSEVFLYCYKQIDTYDSEKSSVSTWIYLIAKSRFFNYCRDKKITENIDDFTDLLGSDTDLPEKAVYLSELREQLNTALLSLTEQQRKIVIMRYFKGKNAQEIAAQFGTSANNIRVQLSKALKNLKKIMENWGES